MTIVYIMAITNGLVVLLVAWNPIRTSGLGVLSYYLINPRLPSTYLPYVTALQITDPHCTNQGLPSLHPV